MEVKITIDTATAARLFAKLTDERLRERVAGAVADEDVLPALAKYPPQSGKPMPMTPAQRRAFFAKLRNGQISVPYRRTGRFGRSFTKQPTSEGMDLTSALSYAPFVRGPGQAAYHRGTWDTLEDMVIALEEDAALTATGVIVEEIADA